MMVNYYFRCQRKWYVTQRHAEIQPKTLFDFDSAAAIVNLKLLSQKHIFQ